MVMGTTKIEYLDETWPIFTGCSPVSEGCVNCWGARQAATRLKHHPRYKGLAHMMNGKPIWMGEVRFNEDVLDMPLKRKRPTVYGVAFSSDFFHEEVPWNYQTKIFGVMRSCPQHTFLILTKRPRRMKDFPFYPWDWPFPNVWLGVTVENQRAADERIPMLIRTPAAVHLVSCEPLLEPVDLAKSWFYPYDVDHLGKIDGVLVGGESGPNARPMHPDWARKIRDDCIASGTPYFFKQWGAWSPDVFHYIDVAGKRNRRPRIAEINWPRWKKCRLSRVGKKTAGRLLDGREWNEMPEMNGGKR